MSWATFGWPLVIVGAGFLLYKFVLAPKIADARKTLGVDVSTAGAASKINNWLVGRKVVLLSAVGGLAQLPGLIAPYVNEATIHEWQSLPWASLLDQATANKISLACTFLVPIVHAFSLVNAAKTDPVK